VTNHERGTALRAGDPGLGRVEVTCPCQKLNLDLERPFVQNQERKIDVLLAKSPEGYAL